MKREIQPQLNSNSLATLSNEQNKILSLVRNQTEQSLVAAFVGKKSINSLSKQETLSIIDTVGYWMANLGIMNSISEAEINMAASFIMENYGSLTIDEVKKAISLSIIGKLNCEVELYGKSFSPKYIAQVLQAFIEYKNNELSDFRNRLELVRMEESKPQPTAKEKMQISIQYFTEAYSDYKKSNSMEYLYIGYEFLKRTKRVKVSKKDIDAALKAGKDAAKTYMRDKYMDGLGNRLSGYNAVNIEQLELRCAKSYVVAQFFNSVNFKEFILSFTEKEFQP